VAALSHQLVVGAFFDDPTVVHDDDAIGILNSGQTVGDEDGRLVSMTALGVDGCSGKLDLGINFFLGDGMAFNAGPQASQQLLKPLIPRWWLNRSSDDFSLLRLQLTDYSQDLIKGQGKLDLLPSLFGHGHHLP
jgi:hypothetical protein